MRGFRNIGLTCLAILALAGGCTAIEENPEMVGAAAIGGTAGLMAGDAIGTTAAQAGLGAAGAIAGIVAAPYLKKRDTIYFDKAIDVAAETAPGKPVRWNNPNTGTTGTLTREDDVDVSTDLTCRRMRSEVKTTDEVTVESMVVCRPDHGTWYIKSSWLVSSKPLDAPAAK